MKNQPKQSPLKLKGENREQTLKIVQHLYEIPRPGWHERGVMVSESIGDKIDATIKLAQKFFPYLIGLDKMLKIVDWPKSKDEVKGSRANENLLIEQGLSKALKYLKYMAEYKAMKDICSPLGDSGKAIFKLWVEYAEQKTDRAKIAQELVRLQRIKRAIQYQKQGEPVNAREFIEADSARISDPRLTKELEKTTMSLLSFGSVY
ncbi:MAG: HD domain-containing protein [Patescibacteria group bacterium]